MIGVSASLSDRVGITPPHAVLRQRPTTVRNVETASILQQPIC